MCPRSTPKLWRKNSTPSGCRSAGLSFCARHSGLQRHGILQARHHRNQSFSRWLVEELEERLPGFDQHLKLHVTGCPNSCGQHWIADIGIEGKKIKVHDRMVDAYYFCVGGALGLHQATARPVGYRCAATEVPDALERLLGTYLSASASPAKICAASLPATATRNCASFWPEKSWPRWLAICPIAARSLAQAAGGIGD